MIPKEVKPEMDPLLFPTRCKVYECWDKSFLAVDFFTADRIDKILDKHQQSGLMSHYVNDERIIFVTYPSGRKVDLILRE